MTPEPARRICSAPGPPRRLCWFQRRSLEGFCRRWARRVRGNPAGWPRRGLAVARYLLEGLLGGVGIMIQHHSAMTVRSIEIGSGQHAPAGPPTRDLAPKRKQPGRTSNPIGRPDGESASPSGRTLECSRNDLVALCRPSADLRPAADRVRSAVDRATQEYPMLSFPVTLMASAGAEAPPVPAILPPSPGRAPFHRMHGFLGLLVLAMFPAVLVTSLRVLHPSPGAQAAPLQAETPGPVAPPVGSRSQPPAAPSAAPDNQQPTLPCGGVLQAKRHHHRSHHHSRALTCSADPESPSAQLQKSRTSQRTQPRMSKAMLARLGLKPME